ncbi:metal-dependent hydrolase [Haloarculaceae archaeon H-GB2-1]|nr:metal-dependent hydrolase [Haloarculaceae archaeon H-GB2-1]
MFVGHALVAFSLVAAVAERRDLPTRRVLLLGALAGAFATLPDVDILYALTGLLGTSGLFDAANSFWATGNLVHRTVTHSLVVGTVIVVAVAGWHRSDRWSSAASLVLVAGLVATVTAMSGPISGVLTMVFVGGALAITALAVRHDVSTRSTAAAAAVGLLSHPFGDLLTGQPPLFLYPFDGTLVTDRIALHADPTVHLLGAFWVELGTAWVALAVFLWVTDRSLRPHLNLRATGAWPTASPRS